MGIASSTRNRPNDQMSTPDGLHKAFVFQNNEMRHFAHRVSRRVGSLHCAARGAIGFLRSLRSATKLSGTDDRRDKKKASLRLFEFASVLVRRDHIACFIALDWRKVSTNIKKRRRGAILSFRCPHLANTCQNGFVFVLFVAEPCVTEDWSICPIFRSQIRFSEVPMMGFEPIQSYSL